MSYCACCCIAHLSFKTQRKTKCPFEHHYGLCALQYNVQFSTTTMSIVKTVRSVHTVNSTLILYVSYCTYVHFSFLTNQYFQEIINYALIIIFVNPDIFALVSIQCHHACREPWSLACCGYAKNGRKAAAARSPKKEGRKYSKAAKTV